MNVCSPGLNEVFAIYMLHTSHAIREGTVTVKTAITGGVTNSAKHLDATAEHFLLFPATTKRLYMAILQKRV